LDSKMNPLNAYRETKVRTASQGKLVVMLYDEAIKQVDIALDALSVESKQLDNVNNAILKSQEIVTELMVSLDFEAGGDIAKNLFSLYMYFNNQLMEANLNKTAKPLRNVRRLMAELRESWESVSKTVPMAENANSAGGVNIAG
jgi:flagellar secretion chaperone FliS